LSCHTPSSQTEKFYFAQKVLLSKRNIRNLLGSWFTKAYFVPIRQKLFADLQTFLRMELISSKAKTLQSGPEVQLVSCLVSVSLNCFISRDPARVIPLI
jgi:hypothetical protein